MKYLLYLLTAYFCTACVYIPTAHEDQPEGCDVITKKLDIKQTKPFAKKSEKRRRVIRHSQSDHSPRARGTVSCNHESCLIVVAAIGIIPVTTFVVSGSIMVVGNFVHWLEVKGRCDDDYIDREKREFIDSLE